MSINTKNTFGAEIRNKVAVIQGYVDFERISNPNLQPNPISSALKDLIILADKLKDMPIEPVYKDLGCRNSWIIYSEEVLKCNRLGHELQETKLNDAGTYREYKCPKCLIFWKTDSSD